MHVRTLLFAAAMSAACVVGARADITGKVQLEGKAPEAKEVDMSGVAECAKLHAEPQYTEEVIAAEDGSLANVAVYVKTDDPSSLGGEVPSEPAVIDQEGCMYKPHVLAMMVGQALIVKNSDPFLHNVHSLAQQNPAFNFGQPNKDPGKKVEPPKTSENIKVKCDVHPWMNMYIIVLEHPFFAVTGEDGAFTIKGELPDGDHTLVAWHEKFGTQEVQVSVSGGKGELAEPIKFKSSGAMANPVENNVRLASLTAKGQSKDGSCGTGCCEDKATDAKLAATTGQQPAEPTASAK